LGFRFVGDLWQLLSPGCFYGFLTKIPKYFLLKMSEAYLLIKTLLHKPFTAPHPFYKGKTKTQKPNYG
jgi:hypothetical protein